MKSIVNIVNELWKQWEESELSWYCIVMNLFTYFETRCLIECKEYLKRECACNYEIVCVKVKLQMFLIWIED